MTVQCEKCHTKYRLADSKVTEQGVKVRCAKCRHIFIASHEPDSFEEAVPAPDFNNVETAAEEQGKVEITVESTINPEFDNAIATAVEDITATTDSAEITMDYAVDQPAEEVDVDLDFGDFLAKEPFGETAIDSQDNPFFIAADTSSSFEETAYPAAETTDNQDFGNLSFLKEDDQERYTEEPPEYGEELVPSPVADLQPEACEPSSPPFANLQQPDHEELFTAPFATDEKLQQPEPLLADSAKDTVTASFDATENNTADFTQVEVEADATTPDESAIEPEQPTAEQSAEDALPETESNGFTPDETEQSQALAPVVISSRRQKNPLFATLITIIGLLIFGALGYMAYVSLYDGKDFLAVFGKSGQQTEEGKITARNIKPVYLTSETAGEMLVINGEAVNQFSKPRASLQLKASVFAPDGTLLINKTAYAGNLLTTEQLLEMEPTQIEAAMANQFGDSLINLEVQPGEAIPFTIVIFNPPEEGQDFSVEAVSSTVATTR
jgi:predicted Zn finger-like uncharacterized protein